MSSFSYGAPPRPIRCCDPDKALTAEQRRAELEAENAAPREQVGQLPMENYSNARVTGDSRHPALDLLVGDLNTLSPADPVGTPPATAEGEDRGPGTSLLTRAVIPLLLEAGYVDCYRTRHTASPGYTYQPPEPWPRLDYIFTSPQLTGRLQACDVVVDAEAAVASDHFPVWAEFREGA